MNKKEEIVLDLAKALSGRWTIPILIAMDLHGDRFTPLQTKTGASPTRLNENLKRMGEQNLVRHISPFERRHPLLPEYILTEKGLMYREIAKAIHSTQQSLNHGDTIIKKWSLPILFSILYENNKFQEIKWSLQNITPKMLSQRLMELHENDFVIKTMEDVKKPIFIYHISKPTFQPIKSLAQDIYSLI